MLMNEEQLRNPSRRYIRRFEGKKTRREFENSRYKCVCVWMGEKNSGRRERSE